MEDDDLLQEIKERFQEAYDAVSADYDEALEDLRFLKGEQWPGDLKGQREADGRPCLVINKVAVHADSVIGDIRMNEPSIKIKPVDSKADPETAEILTGLIRNIEVVNDAETAYDTGAENAAQCGFGCWRVGTKYASDDVFEQDITVRRMKNSFTVYWDPQAQEWDRSDARYCFVTEKIPRKDFEKDYPKAGALSFQGGKDSLLWGDDKTVRVVEYWKKEKTSGSLYLVQATNRMTGQKMEVMTTREKPDPQKLGSDPNFQWEILKERKVESVRLVWYKAHQGEILEGPTEWPGKYIPIIGVWGKELTIEGHSYYRGIVRNAKDPQRLYNYSRSTSAEMISLAPKSPYLVTAKMISEYQAQWNQAHKRNYPYLVYEPDPNQPGGKPERAQPVSANTGIQAEVMTADQELRDSTGIQQASLGMRSNEKSGRAILARQREGDVVNYPYYDNLARALRYQGKVLVDLIPKIYDTARIVRILNKDGTDRFVPINQKFPAQGPKGEAIEKIYDLTVGKYDVVVSVGPSYSTQREEAADSMMEFLKAVPAAAPVLMDLVAKNLDWPGADEFTKRLQALLPPPLQQGAAPGGPTQPPAAPPSPPNPMQVIEMRGKAAEVQGKELDNEAKFRKMRGQMPPEGAGG